MKLGLFLIMMFMCLHISAFSSPVQKSLPSESFKDVDLGDQNIQQELGTGYGNSENYAISRGAVHAEKIAHGIASGAHTGGSTGSGDHKNNGGPGSPYSQGGGENNHHPDTHHGTGNCNRNFIGLLTFIMTALASLMHLYPGWQN